MAELVRQDIATISGGQLDYPVYVLGREPIGEAEFVSGLIELESGYIQCSKSGQIVQSADISQIAERGDIFFSNRNGTTLRTALSKRTHQNTLLVTEQCDNNCTFCSQPPRNLPDYYDLADAALNEFDGSGVIGISGGEPTLHWEKFISLLTSEASRKFSFHVLTHGRNLSSQIRVRELQKRGIINSVLFGIPLHGANSNSHDAVTDVIGSWEETIEGLINLRHVNAALEIRIIITEQILGELDATIALIHSILGTSGYKLALMRLEPTGWAKSHLNLLRPSIERESLIIDEAIRSTLVRGQDISIYNYPLCLISASNRSYACKSISDWKNVYPDKCSKCALKPNCSGLFKSERMNVIDQLRPVL